MAEHCLGNGRRRMKLLYIDCCIRQEASRTRQLCEAFLEGAGRSCEIAHLELQKEGLAPFDRETLDHRDVLLQRGETQDPWFGYARQFAQADAIVVGAPFWDLSFPALLKAYFERISVHGITFTYRGDRCIGLCKAQWGVYLSTAGYDAGDRHLGTEYTKALFAMLGIGRFYSLCAGGLDLAGADRRAIMESKQREVKALASSLL